MALCNEDRRTVHISARKLGAGLRAARKSARLTQAALAAAVGLDPSTIGALEQGHGALTSLGVVLAHLGLSLRSRALPAGRVGPALAALRRRIGLSRRALARDLGVSRTTLAVLEAEGPGRVETLLAYAAALHVRLDLAPREAARTFHVETGASSVFHGWTTPHELGKKLNTALGRVDLDPCAPNRNRRTAPIKARLYLTEEEDGLAREWTGFVFVNPPYGRALPLWVSKSRQAADGGARVVALVPARTDTRWWHDHVVGHAAVLLLRGRLKFGNQAKDAPFASALLAWGLAAQEIDRLRAAFPDAAYIPESSSRGANDQG